MDHVDLSLEMHEPPYQFSIGHLAKSWGPCLLRSPDFLQDRRTDGGG